MIFKREVFRKFGKVLFYLVFGTHGVQHTVCSTQCTPTGTNYEETRDCGSRRSRGLWVFLLFVSWQTFWEGADELGNSTQIFASQSREACESKDSASKKHEVHL